MKMLTDAIIWLNVGLKGLLGIYYGYFVVFFALAFLKHVREYGYKPFMENLKQRLKDRKAMREEKHEQRRREKLESLKKVRHHKHDLSPPTGTEYAKPSVSVPTQHKFIVIVSARNEETVIAQLIESLWNQDYDKENIDILVIADNCTDDTARVAEAAGARVMVRSNLNKRGKGYALAWAIDKLRESGDIDKYDALAVFDADNLASHNFFRRMNIRLCEGEDIIQAYRDVKNPCDSWVASNYAFMYWQMALMCNLPREWQKFHSFLTGSGFVVRTSIIRENGFNTQTITEDLEFTMMQISRGRSVAWERDARAYDEVPVTFMTSWHQRVRWIVGYMQCLKLCGPELGRRAVRGKDARAADVLLFSLFHIMIIFTLFAMGTDIVMTMLLYEQLWWLLPVYFISLFVANLAQILMQVIPALIERRFSRGLLLGLLLSPVFTLSWVPIIVRAFVNPKCEWRSIRHVRGVSIKDLNRKTP